jgi:acyl-CoA dehydrogenase
LFEIGENMNTILLLSGVLATFTFTFLVTPLRRRFITPKVFRLFRKLLPPLSKNEAEALLAGEVGAESTLLGKPDWKALEGKPRLDLSLDEQAYLDGPVNKLCAMLNREEIYKNKDLPAEVWDFMKKIKIFGMNAPREYGGLGFSKNAQRQIIIKIGSRDSDTAITAMVPNSLGPAELLAHYGTEDQKQRWLPGLSSGEIIPCFALTSPTAGSDASSLTDSGVVYRGTDGVPMVRLNGDKRYITLAPVADVVGFACRLYDPEGILGKTKDIGITLILIPVNETAKANGLSIGRRHDPLGGNFMNGPITVNDLCLPLEESAIGGIAETGKGWQMLMKCLFVGRGISLPSISIGSAKFTVRTVGAYARIRKQFGLPLAAFGAIEEWLAKMGGYLYLMEAVGMTAAESVDGGGSSPVISAIAKSHLTEKMREVVTCGMDIIGGKGIIQGPRNFLAYSYKMLPIAITVEGANRVTDGLMIGGQGLMRCHPALSEEMNAVALGENPEAIKKFDRATITHFLYVVSGFTRAIFHAFGGWIFSPAPKKRRLRRYYKKLNRVSSALCVVSELMIWILGGKLKSEERISERLGKVLSHLYIGSSILSRFRKDGEKEGDAPLAEWGLQYSLFGAQTALLEVLDNFPKVFDSRVVSKSLAWIVRKTLFPFGRPFILSSDTLDKKVAQIITTDNESRNRLTAGMYMPPMRDHRETVALFDTTMTLSIENAPVEKRIREAVKKGILADSSDAVRLGIISDKERTILEELYLLREEVITVDDFETLKKVL